jgi:hypothetical protein
MQASLRRCRSSIAASAAPEHFGNVSIIEDRPRWVSRTPDWTRLPGLQKIMLVLAAIGAAVFIIAMHYLLVVMR